MPEWRRELASTASLVVKETGLMLQVLPAWKSPRPASRWLTALASLLLLAGCSGTMSDLLSGSAPSTPSQVGSNIGSGQVKAALILPISGAGSAGVAAQSMRNAAELALAEFNNPDVQLLVKDDGGSAAGAQQAATPVVGFLSSYSSDAFAQYFLPAFHQGLNLAGYVEGQNVAVEYDGPETNTSA